MKGTLDEPPIIVSQNREKTGVLILLEVAFLAWVVTLTTKHDLLGYCLVALLVVSASVLTCTLFKSLTLTIAPKGIRVKTLFRCHCYAWWQVHSFHVVNLVTRREVWFEFRTDGIASPRSCGMLWELGPAELCKLLNEARSRWAESGRTCSSRPPVAET